MNVIADIRKRSRELHEMRQELCASAVESLAAILRKSRIPCTSEAIMQDALAKALENLIGQANVFREVRTVTAERSGRLDFYLAIGTVKIAIECKVKGSFDDLLKQCARYLDVDATLPIDGLIVVSSVAAHRDMPVFIFGKSIAVVWTSTANL